MNKSKNKIVDEVLYGFHPVLEALNARKRVIRKLFFTNHLLNRFSKLISLAKDLSIDYEVVENSRIKSISKVEDHQGVLALVSPLPMFLDVKNFLEKGASSFNLNLLVILDGILDPHNFGAIIRTAYCVGASCIITTKNRACYPTPAVSKISAGALEHLPICCVTNLSSSIKILKKKGFWIVGMDLGEKTSNVFNLDMTGKIVVVIGNEKKGIRPLVSTHCDFMASVPMEGKLNSLNASVAAAVVLYEIFKQKSLL